MSNQLCQMAGLPGGEGRSVCHNHTPPPPPHLPLLPFPPFTSPPSVSLTPLATGGEESGTLFPPRATEQKELFCQGITPPLQPRLLSLRLYLREGSIWPLASSSGSRRDRWGEKDAAAQCASDGRAAWKRRPRPTSSGLTWCAGSRLSQTSRKCPQCDIMVKKSRSEGEKLLEAAILASNNRKETHHRAHVVSDSVSGIHNSCFFITYSVNILFQWGR